MEAASFGQPIAKQAAADATQDATDGQNACQCGGIRFRAQFVHALVERSLPTDQRPAADVVQRCCNSNRLQQHLVQSLNLR